MIQPSMRRRASRPSEAEAFRLHARIASRRVWNVRLLRGGLGALLVSVVAAALGTRPWLQAVALGAAFALAAALPVRGEMRRALRYIRERSGLAYETSLESTPGEDPFGFVAAVRARAVDSVRDVRLPELPAWWLPALAAALALLLFPLSGRQLGPAGGRGSVEGPTPAAQTGARRPGGVATPPAPGPPRAPSTGTPAAPSQAGAQEAGGAGQGPTSDQQVLSRYLESLQQPAGATPGAAAPGTGTAAGADTPAPPLQPGAGTPSGRAAPSGANTPPGGTVPGTAPPGTSPGNAREGEAAPSTNGAPPGSQAPGTGSGGARPEAGARSGNNAQPGAGDGQAGAGARPPANNQSAPGAGTPGGTGQRPGANGPSGPSAAPNGVPSPEASGPLGGGAAGKGAAAPSGEGMAPGGPKAGGDGTGGNTAGAPGAAGNGVSGSGPAPEFLPGQLGAGQQIAAGALRLPGVASGALPPGSSLESYRRAAEQALTQGDIPLEYQDVIRNYFR